MLPSDLSRVALELPPEERLELARRSSGKRGDAPPSQRSVTEGIRRIEDIATGRLAGLTEEQYRAALR